eukprot:TRINITY_DN24779_c0_g3_i1.p1 TRINITY_DN24779_c0_g3~~TRINITY_DN24779_c0_g3_i1.p1  ORF type:complete len:667 (+),score=86.42 TRINITY_DN24779_c0_g3_i1:26-2026(+)
MVAMLLGALLWLCLATLVAAPAPRAALPRRFGIWRQGDHTSLSDAEPSRPSVANCTWRLFHQKLDHFGSAPGTFPQRLCIYDGWWRRASAAQGDSPFRAPEGAPGPILFYTGNESPIEEYINNTGLMWDVGRRLGALIVFAEHRYEPLSHPTLCGHGTERCFAYCTTAQALADWVAIISDLRRDHEIRAPAVAFGGSYGGMLAGWLRMKYPEHVDGAIAASAPIWQFASTVLRDTLDMQAVAVSRGVSAAGGASDQCFENLRVAWPLLEEVGKTPHGLRLLSESIGSCEPLKHARDFTSWAQSPYFLLAEGNYPFPSTYITYSVGPGLNPLPAWPMRVACQGLSHSFGIQVNGSLRDVRYTASMNGVRVSVDWNVAMGNGVDLSESEIKASGVLSFAAAIADAAGVWYNVTKDKKCWNMSDINPGMHAEHVDILQEQDLPLDSSEESETDCPACPPCEDCPPCPVSRCEKTSKPCSFTGTVPKTFSWEGICCNDDLSQIDAKGLGRDIYWPPTVPSRNYSVETVVGPKGLRQGCAETYDALGLRGAPTVSDPWSSWLTSYYGGRNVSHHRNIVWSNGALDPWSGQGVYPPGGGPDGPMVQNISKDGSQIALVLDLGAHHLDLMFPDAKNDPPCARKAREIEAQMVHRWCQEAYDSAATRTTFSAYV